MINIDEPTRLIGITGYREHGKTEFAYSLISAFDWEARHLSIVDPIEDIACEAFDISFDQTHNHRYVVDDRYGLSPAEIFEKVSNSFAQIYPDIWIRDCIETAYHGWIHSTYWVIDDISTEVEANAVRECGGLLVNVHLLDPDGNQIIPDDQPEIAAIDTDFVVLNDGEDEDLLACQARIVKRQILRHYEKLGANIEAL
jgi:hypothetical protein